MAFGNGRVSNSQKRSPDQAAALKTKSLGARPAELLEEPSFAYCLALERRRAERSRRPFILMLLDLAGLGTRTDAHKGVVDSLALATRETDMLGWYETNQVIGVVFAEVGSAKPAAEAETFRARIMNELERQIGPAAARIVISIHIFPQAVDSDSSGPLADEKLYPELSRRDTRVRLSLAVKRAIDIVGSAGLLALFSPLFALIAVAIKLSSKGPVFFRQERLGQFGSRFQCLKFRTMFVNNDPKIHQEYAKRFISNNDCAHKEGDSAPVYKIINDPRVTWVGRWLRKTSLDELPQFLNVLCGDMSLVGPRPPVFYEFILYDYWHQRRVLELKPGVTGLWQVNGRSSTNFDEMVRLDLRYHRSWSIWLDIKILLRTPFAVIFGAGAY